MRVRGEVVISPDEDKPGDTQAEHEELAASGGLVAGWFAGVGFGGHRSIQAQGCGTHLLGCHEVPRAALRFARIPQKRKGCGAHRQTNQELLRAALRFARIP